MSFPLFQGERRGCFPELVGSLSFMPVSLVKGLTSLRRPPAKPLIAVSLRAMLALIDRGAIDPIRSWALH